MGSPPGYFFGVRNLPPGGVIPQAQAAPPMSRSRDGLIAWAGLGGGGRHKTATPGHNLRWIDRNLADHPGASTITLLLDDFRR
jgi:hypothetical protein